MLAIATATPNAPHATVATSYCCYTSCARVCVCVWGGRRACAPLLARQDSLLACQEVGPAAAPRAPFAEFAEKAAVFKDDFGHLPRKGAAAEDEQKLAYLLENWRAQSRQGNLNEAEAHCFACGAPCAQHPMELHACAARTFSYSVVRRELACRNSLM